MIFGHCPYCDHPHDFAVGTARLPLFQKVECENCHKIFYEYLSRIEPTAYKAEEVIVDEVKHSIKIKAEEPV